MSLLTLTALGYFCYRWLAVAAESPFGTKPRKRAYRDSVSNEGRRNVTRVLKRFEYGT